MVEQMNPDNCTACTIPENAEVETELTVLKKILELQKEAFADMHRELRDIKVRLQEIGR